MAGGSVFIWVALLSCGFQASGSRHDVKTADNHTRNPQLDHIIFQIPSDIDETCPGVKEQLTSLNSQATRRYNQLDGEAFELRSEVRLLNLKLATCSATASAITNSYQDQLYNKMKRQLQTYDSETFQILNFITLTREVNALRRKIETAASNSTQSAIDTTVLQRQLQEKIDELQHKKEQIEKTLSNAALIFQIVSLQNQIWDLEQEESRRGEISLQPNQRMQALQGQLDRLISELREKGDPNSALLELISVHSTITVTQRILTLHIEKSRTNAADYQKQWRQKIELLKKKIMQLSRDEHNSELTQEILDLQSEVDRLRQLMQNAKTGTDSRIKELRIFLDEKNKRLRNLQVQLEETDFAQAQMVMKIISLMKEVRELRDPEQQTTSTGQETTLETLLQAKEREYSNALAEIDELQKTLRLKTEECSGLEERYQQAKTELDKKIAELNKTGDSKEALILALINLKNDLKAIEALISNTDDPDRITELKRQLEQKQDEVIFKTAEIEKVFANPRIILTIIELQDDIRDLQKKAANETNHADIKGLQNRLDDLLSQIDDKDDENTKLMLTIMALQIQVEYLQKQLSERHTLQAAQVTELTTELTDKRKELQKYVSELTEKNQTNAELILTITDLQNKLRNLGKEKGDEAQTTSSRIAKLKEQLKDKEEEHDRDQAEIEALQNKLNQTEAQCSNYEQKLRDLQNDLDDKMKELESKSNSVTSLALQISTLSLQIEELKNQLENTESKSKIRELEAIIEEKNKELEKKKEELKARSAQPRRLLEIIELQTQIEKLSNVAANESDYFKIQALQDHLNHLINGIQDDDNENTKLTFQILAQQDEIARLKKQEKKQLEADLEKIKELENELDDVRNQIKEKTALLESSDLRVTNLSTQIMELHKKLKPLEDQISDVKNTNTEKLAEIQKRLELTKRQLQDSERQLNDADAKNYNLLMEIAELRAQLKKAEKKPPKVDGNKIKELEQQLQTQQREKKILESTNNDLKEDVKELKMCCSDVNTQCEDLQKQLQQSQEDTDRLQQRLKDKDAELAQLREEKDAELAQQKDAELAKLRQEKDAELAQLRQEKDAELAKLRQEKDAELAQLQKELEKQARENNKLEQENSDLQRQLRQTDSNADCLLQLQDKDTIITQLHKELENQTNEYDQLLQEICDLKRQLRQSDSNADCLLQLQDKDTIITQLQQELENQANEHNQLQLEYSELENEKKKLSDSLEELRNQLDDVEDKTIHPRSVTFDPDTAHARILLSAGNTEMSTAAREQNVPNLPGRFDVALAALGSPGFSSGRQYWEVSIAGRLCFQIGMASESSPRKGALSFRPSTGYWTIVLNKQGVYKAIDKRVVTLRVRTHPITFGILLDYKKGQISFYDAGARSHLYTFTGQRFTDKIYPFVLYCVEEHDNRSPISLLPPASIDWIN